MNRARGLLNSDILIARFSKIRVKWNHSIDRSSVLNFPGKLNPRGTEVEAIKLDLDLSFFPFVAGKSQSFRASESPFSGNLVSKGRIAAFSVALRVTYP